MTLPTQTTPQLIRSTVRRQLEDPRFAEFCITHVTNASYTFLYGGEGHAAYVAEFNAMALPKKRLRDLTHPDDLIYASLQNASAENDRKNDASVSSCGGRSFYFTSRGEFDCAMEKLRRALGWSNSEDALMSSDESASEAFVEFMFCRRTRTACFLHMLSSASLHLWKMEQQGGRDRLQCHVRRGSIFYVAAMLLLRHASHITRPSTERGARLSLVYDDAFRQFMPMIASLASQRCTVVTSGLKAADVAASDQSMQYVAETIQSLADGQVVPDELVRQLKAAVSVKAHSTR
jgi:hypothetical protein